MSTILQSVQSTISHIFEYRLVVKNRQDNVLLVLPLLVGMVGVTRFRKQWKWFPIVLFLNYLSPFTFSIAERSRLYPEPTEQDLSIKTEIVRVTPAPVARPITDFPIVYTATPKEKPVEKEPLQPIKGIGPKYEQALYDAGIKTIQQIAESSAETLIEKLQEQGITRQINVQEWIDQARAM